MGSSTFQLCKRRRVQSVSKWGSSQSSINNNVITNIQASIEHYCDLCTCIDYCIKYLRYCSVYHVPAYSYSV